ncbi:MAG TPA: hypothetical protein VGA99_12620 [bacterium]
MLGKKKKNQTTTVLLSGLGFVLGLGAAFLFGTQRGKKYRDQIGEFTADFFESIADGCKQIRKDLSR